MVRQLFLFSHFFSLFFLLHQPRFLRNRKKHPEWSLFKKITNVDEEDHKLGAFRARSTMRPVAKAEMEVELNVKGEVDTHLSSNFARN
jgi:hypothetical protein